MSEVLEDVPARGEIIPTDAPPERPATKVGPKIPELLLTGAHNLCPGCGEPTAARIMLEALLELGLAERTIATIGIGCYVMLSASLKLEVVQALHGRAPSVATGVKRMRPDATVFTLQGDGDMVNEGLQEVLHAAARGENITCVLLNNGVFGETGGQMTATSVIGQRTKSTLQGRNAAMHGYPISITTLIAQLEGAAYVARGAVNDFRSIKATRRMLRRAFEAQRDKLGFSIVEILTMCPTGWFVSAPEGPNYMHDTLGKVHVFGELKAPPRNEGTEAE
jgi:2-oxoglutarate ferredoxin oxidoreductase subunit beta